MSRRGLVIAGVVALALGGCLESRPGVVAGDVTTDGDGGSGVVPACSNPTAAVASTGTSERAPWQVVSASSHEILFSGDEWISEEEPGIWRLDIGSDTVSMVPGTTVDDVLVDARDGAMLVVRRDDDPAVRRLFYVDAAVEVELASEPNRFWGYPGYVERGRYVAPGVAAWRSCLYDAQGRCVRSSLRAWKDGATTVLWERESDSAIVTPPLPEVDAAGVLWTEPVVADDGTASTSAIRAWAGDEPLLLRTVEGDVRRVLRVGDELVWLTEVGVWRARGDGAASQLGARWCASAYTDGERVVMLCEEPGGTNVDGDGVVDAAWSPFPGGTGELWLYDGGGELVRIPSEGALRAVPVVDGGVVAWVTYESTDAGCFPSNAGTVWAAPAAAPERAVAIADIGAGCYCCDSIWPELQLSLRDGLLAWNYGLVPPEELSYEVRGGFLSWARVRVSCN